MARTFRDWGIEQLMMFPASVKDFGPGPKKCREKRRKMTSKTGGIGGNDEE